MYTQVVSSLFTYLELYEHIWKEVKTSEKVPTFGFRFEVGLEPVNVNVERMIKAYQLGMESLTAFLEKILIADELKELQLLTKKDQKSFHFSDELWVKVVFRYAIAFHRKVWSADQLMKSMIPLYMGRTASFVIANMESSADQVEKNIESLCQSFENQKSLLIQDWENHRLI
jgi:hypothetical protein